MVCIEDLQVRNMSKSAKGTAEAPGKNVRSKSGLNKAILDQGWFEFRRQLEYKLDWNGGYLIAVPPHNTSRTCPCCGHISADNRKTQAIFRCVACGHKAHADVVGALNILARGHRAATCGEDVSRAKSAKAQRAPSVKQEPAEAITAGRMSRVRYQAAHFASPSASDVRSSNPTSRHRASVGALVASTSPGCMGLKFFMGQGFACCGELSSPQLRACSRRSKRSCQRLPHEESLPRHQHAFPVRLNQRVALGIAA